MIPLRTQVKFFLESSQGVNIAAFSGVFQRWIQENALNELLIDVADYRHVFEGPSVILIGHANDYTIENRDGRLGLLYTRKRQTDEDLQTQLRAALQRALTACGLLETETSFTPRLKFRADEIEIRFPDRLQLPNRPETFDLVKADLEAVLTDLYGDKLANIAPSTLDTRQLFTLNVRGEGVSGISDLFRQAQPSAEV